MYPHRIRLRGPWTVEPLFRYGAGGEHVPQDLPAPFRMTMPGRLDDFRGGLRLIRPFGYPGRIDAYERVWLTFDDVDGRATVALNDQHLGAVTGPAEFDVTALLQSRNRLVVEMDCPEPGGLPGEVALEIRATAFLRGITFTCHRGELTATGLVVGEAPRPLELYLFAGGRFLVYQQVETTPAGQAFTLTGKVEGEPPLSARVELVDAATIWYVVQGVVPGGQSNHPADSSLG